MAAAPAPTPSGGSAADAAAAAAARPINPLAAARNLQAAAFVRTLVAVVVGAACGILGLTGAAGFAAYAVQHAVVAAVLLRAVAWRPAEYFHGQSPSVAGGVLAGAGDNVLSFLLLWTLAYALVHVY